MELQTRSRTEAVVFSFFFRFFVLFIFLKDSAPYKYQRSILQQALYTRL